MSCKEPAVFEIGVEKGPMYFACREHLLALIDGYFKCWELNTGDVVFQEEKLRVLGRWGADLDDPKACDTLGEISLVRLESKEKHLCSFYE